MRDSLKFDALLRWLLRMAVAVQGLGVAVQYLFHEFEQDSDIFGVLLFDWQWRETWAKTVDDTGSWCYFTASMIVLFVPLAARMVRFDLRRKRPQLLFQTLPLIYIASWQVLLILAAWHRDAGFLPTWAPLTATPQFTLPLVFLSQSARVGLPIALILLNSVGKDDKPLVGRIEAVMWVLRGTAAATFFGHGIKSLYLNPQFVDYLLAGANNLLGWDATESTINLILRVIGTIDILMAVLILLTRWRAIAAYMACWAFIGAWSRVVHSNWDALNEVFIRSANYCVPLAVCLYWQWCHRSRAPEPHTCPVDEFAADEQ